GLHRFVHLGRAALGIARDDVVEVRRVDALPGDISAELFTVDQMGQCVGHGIALSVSDNSPRAARLRISARVPNVHGGASREVATIFASMPRLGVEMRTSSPILCVKPRPGSSRSSVGANKVPRNSTKPSG